MLAETGEALTYRCGGRDYEIPAAVSVSDETLLWALRDTVHFAHFAQVPTGYTYGQVEELRLCYCKISGLPEDHRGPDTLRSILLQYGDELEADFAREYSGMDPGELWRARRWRRLRNLIDKLPKASLYRERILNDPEMVRRMLEQEKDKEKPKGGTAISEYTAEVALLRDVIGEIRVLRSTLVGVNSKNGKAPKVEPYPGPITAVQRAEFNMRKERHEKLTARVLPRKRDPQETVE